MTLSFSAIVLMPVSETFDEQLLHSQKNVKWRYYLLSTIIRTVLVLVTIGVAEIFGDKLYVLFCSQLHCLVALSWVSLVEFHPMHLVSFYHHSFTWSL